MSAGPGRPAASTERVPARIVLTGFMGAGKSTVGRILAARVGWRFFDTDSLITQQHRLSVAEIFRQHGEARFREWETDAVRSALKQCECVLALGGGAIESPVVRELLFSEAAESEAAESEAAEIDALPATQTIYLQAPLTELLTRCARAAGNSSGHQPRPLLAAGPDETEARFERRLAYYERAPLTLPTAGKSPEEVVETVLERIAFLRGLASTGRAGASSPIASNSKANS